MAGRLATGQDFILKNFVVILAFCSLSFLYTSHRETLQGFPADRSRSSSKAPVSRTSNKFASKEQAAPGIADLAHQEEVDSPTSRPKSSMPDFGDVEHFAAGRQKRTGAEEGKSRSSSMVQKQTPTSQLNEAPTSNTTAGIVPLVLSKQEKADVPEAGDPESEEESVVIDIPEKLNDKKKYQN
eukprot:s923_g31.t1